MRTPSDWLNDAMVVPTPKMATPIRKVRFLPMMSASLPPIRMNDAMTSA